MTREQHTQTELDDNARNWLGAYIHAKAEERRWADIAQRAREHLEAQLGDAEEGLVDGQVAVRWTVVTSHRLDQTKLKENHPDVVEACMVPSTSRRFCVTDRP